MLGFRLQLPLDRRPPVNICCGCNSFGPGAAASRRSNRLCNWQNTFPFPEQWAPGEFDLRSANRLFQPIGGRQPQGSRKSERDRSSERPSWGSSSQLSKRDKTCCPLSLSPSPHTNKHGKICQFQRKGREAPAIASVHAQRRAAVRLYYAPLLRRGAKETTTFRNVRRWSPCTCLLFRSIPSSRSPSSSRPRHGRDLCDVHQFGGEAPPPPRHHVEQHLVSALILCSDQIHE